MVSSIYYEALHYAVISILLVLSGYDPKYCPQHPFLTYPQSVFYTQV